MQFAPLHISEPSARAESALFRARWPRWPAFEPRPIRASRIVAAIRATRASRKLAGRSAIPMQPAWETKDATRPWACANPYADGMTIAMPMKSATGRPVPLAVATTLRALLTRRASIINASVSFHSIELRELQVSTRFGPNL